MKTYLYSYIIPCADDGKTKRFYLFLFNHYNSVDPYGGGDGPRSYELFEFLTTEEVGQIMGGN